MYLKNHRLLLLLSLSLILGLTPVMSQRCLASFIASEDPIFEDQTDLFFSAQEESSFEAAQEEGFFYGGEDQCTAQQEDTILDSQPLYDLLEEAAQDAQEHAQGDNWFSSETDGQDPGDGKGGLSPSPTPDPFATSEPNPSPTPGPDPSLTPNPSLSPTPTPHPAFQVEKKALVSYAKPGDTVIYTIKITNTGNVDLHSVLSTERFQGAGAKAYFEEQEGVTLNETRTQALVPRLRPGEHIVLTAYVIIPYTALPQQLLNQVEVITDETGPSIISDEAVLPLVSPAPSQTPPYNPPAQPADPNVPQVHAQSLPVVSQTAPVQTGGSPSYFLSFALLIFSGLSLTSLLWICLRRKA